jgi:hypothetical protein
MIYSQEDIQKRVDRLHELYDLNKPIDLFTLIPQEMEIAEVRAMRKGLKGQDMKKAVVDTILAIAKHNSIELDEDLLSVFVNTIADASKGRFAINKEKT